MAIEILVVHVHSMRNAGDAALTLETIDQLRRNFQDGRITLAMDDCDAILDDISVVKSVFAWVKSISERGITSWKIGNLITLPFTTLFPVLTYRVFGRPLYWMTPPRLRPTIDSYIRADLVVSKPGGFFYGSGKGLSLAILIYTLALAWLAGKPFYIYPQSFGPLISWWEGWLLRWILGKARIIMVREPISLELLRRHHIRHPQLYLLPDIAFAFPGVTRADAIAWLHDYKIDLTDNLPLLGMTVVNWGAQNPNFDRQAKYETACIEAIRYFVNQIGGKVIIFPQVTGPSMEQDDRIPARRIAARLAKLEDSIFLLEQPPPPRLLKTLYGQMDVFIGTRMHSNIFALSEGVPVIAIGYMHKTYGIAKMLGLEQWVVDIRKLTPEALVDKLVALWRERENLKTQITTILPSLIEQVAQAGSLCAEDFARLRRGAHG